MTDLSPTAQAVLDAVAPHPAYGPAIAAALRAAAGSLSYYSETESERRQWLIDEADLLAIAAELGTLSDD